MENQNNTSITHTNVTEFIFDTFTIYYTEEDTTWRARHEDIDKYEDEIILEDSEGVTFTDSIPLFESFELSIEHFNKLKSIIK